MTENKLCQLILPSGNFDELPDIMERLKNLHIPYTVTVFDSGGFMVEFSSDRVQFLPKDRKGHYVPVTDDSGHSFSTSATEQYKPRYWW